MTVDIGIIGAMVPEVEAIIAALDNHECECISGIDFHTGKIGAKTVAVGLAAVESAANGGIPVAPKYIERK